MINKAEKFNAVICLIDLLGYKQMIKERSLEEISDLILNTFDDTVNGCNHFLKRDLERFKKFGGYDIDVLHLEWLQFSDTILLYLKCDEESKFPPHLPEERLLSMTYYLPILFANCLRNDILLRGAVSYGEVMISKQKNFFVGIPIIEAYELEKEQKWAGISLCESAEILSSENPYIVKYDVPLKNEISKGLFVCNWCRQHSEEIGWDNLFNSNEKDVICKKDNTKRFYESNTRNIYRLK